MTDPARPYRGRGPQERLEERRLRLLAAGREGLAHADGSTLSVGEVCARARVSKRHFYELFDDRLDLVHAVHADAVQWFKDGFDQDGDPADPCAWLAEVVPWLFAKLLEDPPRARVLARVPAVFPSAAPNLGDLVVDGLVRRVRQVPGRPSASPERVRRHAVGAVSAGRAVLVEWLLADGEPRRGRAMSDYVADVLTVTTAALSPVLP